MKIKRAFVLLFAVMFGFSLILSGCDNLFGSDDDDDSISQEDNGGTNDDTYDTENYTSDTIGTLVYVPAGSFQRRGGEDNISIISRPFRMGVHQITQAQFEAVMGVNPSHFTDGDDAPSRPVEKVSWYDAIAFASKVSLSEGLTPVYSVTVDGAPVDWADLEYENIPTADNADWNAATADWPANGYRLPTEMEWMWAAMGAAQDAQPGAMQDGINRTGYDKPFAGYNGSNNIDDYAWYAETSGHSDDAGTTHPVGTKLPNELGLYDMSGNVWEWNWDWIAARPEGERTDYRGAASGSERILRGGAWGSNASACTVDSRNNFPPEDRSFQTRGFRLVRP